MISSSAKARNMSRAHDVCPMTTSTDSAEQCCGPRASPLAAPELFSPPCCRSPRPAHLVLTSTPCPKSCSASCP